MESTGATRVVVDALTELQLPTASDETRFREFMYSLVQRCARNGVTVVMTMQVPELFGITRLAEGSISLLADNVLLLQYLRGESQIKRALTVLKSRASTHDPFIHEFTITDRGIVVGGTFGPEQDLR